MNEPILPQNVTRLEKDELFSFSCHPDLDCFTECCRELELALTPYDIMQMKQAVDMHSSAFLDKYVIVEFDPLQDSFPRFYLTMVDDGKASCVFVTESGCSIYKNRPGACRTYPMGRAAIKNDDNSIDEFFVLIKESHCQGFNEQQSQTSEGYCNDQGLDNYIQSNDLYAKILQHEQIRTGKSFSNPQINMFITSLFDLDKFREMIIEKQLPPTSTPEIDLNSINNDDDLLLYAYKWISEYLFANA